MVELAPPSPKKRTWIRRSLFGLLLVMVAALLTHRVWLPPLASSLLPALASRFGDLELEVEVLELATDRVELRNLRARQRGEHPILERADADSIVVEFSLRALVRGELEGLARVNVEGLELDLHLERLEAGGSAEPESDAPELPASLPVVDLDVRFLKLVLPGGVTLSSQRGRLTLDETGRLAAGALSVQGDEEGGSWSTRPLSMTGVWRDEAVEELELQVDQARLLRPSRVDLARVLEGAVGLDLDLDLGQPESRLAGTLDGSGADFELVLRAAELSSLLANSPIELPLTMRGRLDLTSSGELIWSELATARGEVDFELTQFEALGRSVQRSAGRGTLAEGWLDVPRLEVHQQRNVVVLHTLRWPLTAGDPQSWLSETSGSFNLAIEDLSAITGPLPLPERYRELPPHSLKLDAELSAGRVRVTQGRLESSGGTVELTRAELAAGESWRDPWSLEARGITDIQHLDQVGLLVGRDDWWGRLEGALDVRGTWPNLVGGWTLDGRNLRFGSAEVGSLSMEVNADGDELRLAHLRASGRGIQLDASAGYSIEAGHLHDGELELSIPQLVDWAPGVFDAGSAVLGARVSGKAGELVADGELETSGLVLRGVRVENARASLVGRGSEWRCDVLHAESEFGVLDAALGVQLDDAGRLSLATLERFELVKGEAGLRLASPATLEVVQAAEGRGGRISRILLDGEAGRLEASGSYLPSGLVVDATIEDVQPNIFLAGTSAALPKLTGLDGILHVEGPLEAPQFETRGKLRQLFLPNATASADLSWSVTRDGDSLNVDELRLSGTQDLTASVTGAVPVDAILGESDEALTLKVQVDLPLLELSQMTGLQANRRAAGRVRIDGTLRGSLEELSGGLAIAAEDLRWDDERHPSGLGTGSVRGELTLDRGLRARDVEVRLGELLDVRVSGDVSCSTSARKLVRDPRTLLEGASVEAQATIGTLDLEALSGALGELAPRLRQLRGGTIAGTLSAQGPLLEPRLDGVLEVHEGVVRLGSGLPTAEALEARLALEGESFEIRNLTGELGGAPFEISGNATLAGAGSIVHFQLTGDDLLLFRSREARLRANANLSVEGPLSALAVSGTLDLSDGRYAPSTEFLDLRGSSKARGARGFQIFHLREEPLSNMSFDIELTSLAPFVVRNTVMNGSVRPKLHLGGKGLLPVLSGEVFLDRTLLKLPASTLELTGGTVLFDRDDPFMPTVEVSGRTRMLGYDIKASISGEYDSPEVVLSSTPPLSQESLLLLVLTGRLPNDPDQTDPLATANTVALYLAKDSLARWFADDGPMNEDSLFNRFEFAAGKDVSKNGVETVDVAYRLTSKEGLPPDRRNRRHLFMAGERDRFEDYNYGFRLVFRLR